MQNTRAMGVPGANQEQNRSLQNVNEDFGLDLQRRNRERSVLHSFQ
jgi:hypothetical protein